MNTLRPEHVAGGVCILPGLGMLGYYLAITPTPSGAVLAVGVLLLVVGAFLFAGFDNIQATCGKWLGLKGERHSNTDPGEHKKKILAPDELQQREQVAATKSLPGISAPSFNAVRDALPLSPVPWADQMTPAYILDKEFRIIDWNIAFGLAFDRTMEGHRGHSVLQWIYFLDNFEEVLDHAEKFVEVEELPPIDVEKLKYTNIRYGSKLDATKRAYRLPDDTGATSGWLVTLETKFEDDTSERRFRLETLSAIRLELTWTEYAISYDRILTNTDVYPRLLETIVGSNPDFSEIPPLPAEIAVMDLGAGTGNLTRILADRGEKRTVYAIENNRTMLSLLRSNLSDQLQQDEAKAGVLAIKQDVSSLSGFTDGSMDAVLMNNVLYTLSNPSSCLREVFRVLKPGGEVRITGPKRSTRLSKLFRQIERDLQDRRIFEDLQSDFNLVKRINEQQLSPLLYKWNVEDIESLLADAGFCKPYFSSEKVYAGQGLIVCARK